MKKEIKEVDFKDFCDKIDLYIDTVHNKIYFFYDDYLYKAEGLFLKEITFIDLDGFLNTELHLWYLLISMYPGSKLYLNPYREGGIKTTVPNSLTEYLNNLIKKI